MKSLINLGVLSVSAFSLLLSGCALDTAKTPDGRQAVRGRLGTNTALDVTAEGPAADILANNLVNLPDAPPGWNDGGEPNAPLRRPGVAASTSNGISYLRIINGENQTKGLWAVAAGIVGWGYTDAMKATNLAKTGKDQVLGVTKTKAATRQLIDNNATKVKLAEIEAAASAAPVVVPPVPVP